MKQKKGELKREIQDESKRMGKEEKERKIENKNVGGEGVGTRNTNLRWRKKKVENEHTS